MSDLHLIESESDYDGGPYCEVCGDATHMTDEYQTCDQCGSYLCPKCFGPPMDDLFLGTCKWCIG